MTGGEVVALVSVVVSGIVGPVVTHAWGARQAKTQTRVSREDELRAVLELAAIRLTESIQRLDDARDKAPSNSRSDVAPLEEDRSQLWKNEDRIGVRLGSASPEFDAFNAGSQAFATAVRHLSDLANGIGKSDQEFREIVDARNEAFRAHRRFCDLSAARLSPDASPARRKRTLRAKRDPPELDP